MTLTAPASAGWTPLAGCEGKVRFDSPTLAAAAAKRKPHRKAYRCPGCKGWHVGNVDRGRVERQRRWLKQLLDEASYVEE